MITHTVIPEFRPGDENQANCLYIPHPQRGWGKKMSLHLHYKKNFESLRYHVEMKGHRELCPSDTNSDTNADSSD